MYNKFAGHVVLPIPEQINSDKDTLSFSENLIFSMTLKIHYKLHKVFTSLLPSFQWDQGIHVVVSYNGSAGTRMTHTFLYKLYKSGWCHKSSCVSAYHGWDQNCTHIDHNGNSSQHASSCNAEIKQNHVNA